MLLEMKASNVGCKGSDAKLHAILRLRSFSALGTYEADAVLKMRTAAGTFLPPSLTHI